MSDLQLHQGEGKPLQLTYKNTVTKKAVDLTGAAMSFVVRSSKGGEVLIAKLDSDFNKGLAGDGIITFSIAEDETEIPEGLYYAQARARLSSTNKDLTQIYEIEILPSLFSQTNVTGLLDGKVTVTA